MKREDLRGKQFGELKVLSYIGNGKWECQCSCGKIHIVSGKMLRSGDVKSCGHTRSKFGDLTGKQFGDWRVLSKLKRGQYLCECSCGVRKAIYSTDLVYGKSKSCGHLRKAKDLTGMQIGEWKVINKTENYKYLCECSCGVRQEVNQSDLKNGKSLSCGHGKNKLINLEGKQFGSWAVIGHLGYGKWLCQCECGALKAIRHTELLNGQSKSCGCKKRELLRNTMLSRYGEIASSKIDKKRTVEQIEYTYDAEKLKKAIEDNFDHKPLVYELEPLLGLTYSRIIKIIHSFGLENSVELNEATSRYEQEIIDIIHDIDDSLEVIKKAKIFPQSPRREVDIYIPSKRLAIEFNGDYWHSELYKDLRYHQNKTIDCSKLGIQLIHIFEYEWNDESKREKLIKLIENRITSHTMIYARQCTVRKIETNSTELIELLNNNHIQGYSVCSIAYGLYFKNILIGAITFGKPRYSNQYEYELIRLVFRQGINVIGGSEKLFKAFLDKHNTNSIVSYCDISKFNGGVYSRLGFSTDKDSITKPSYIWINFDIGNIQSRYETQKHKLLQKNIGGIGESEAEIMHRLGYVKIYDCGNLRFIWNRQDR